MTEFKAAQFRNMPCGVAEPRVSTFVTGFAECHRQTMFGLPGGSEILVALLRSTGNGDPAGLAVKLLSHFGTFSEVLGAPAGRLAEIDGLGPQAINLIKVAQMAAQRFARDALPQDKPLLTCRGEMIHYLRTVMAFEPVEQFRVIFLDRRNRLIGDEVQQVGTIGYTPVFPREVMRRSLELFATAIVLVHNHPSGEVAPSAADIALTRAIVSAASALDIVVHDHIIIGRDGHSSMRELKLM